MESNNFNIVVTLKQKHYVTGQNLQICRTNIPQWYIEKLIQDLNKVVECNEILEIKIF